MWRPCSSRARSSLTACHSRVRCRCLPHAGFPPSVWLMVEAPNLQEAGLKQVPHAVFDTGSRVLELLWPATRQTLCGCETLAVFTQRLHSVCVTLQARACPTRQASARQPCAPRWARSRSWRLWKLPGSCTNGAHSPLQAHSPQPWVAPPPITINVVGMTQCFQGAPSCRPPLRPTSWGLS